MDESIANPDLANPMNQAKEADPLWPEAGLFKSVLLLVNYIALLEAGG